MSAPGKVYQKLSPGWLIMLINELVYITLPDIAKQFHFANIVYVAVINHTVLILIASLFHLHCAVYHCMSFSPLLSLLLRVAALHIWLAAASFTTCFRLQKTTKTESAFCSL